MEDARQIAVDREWYCVRCLIHDELNGWYEERVTLWDAASADEAIDRALGNAREYASNLNVSVVDFAQAYRLPALPSGAGDEVFSLIRRCELVADDYVAQFFDTGRELQERG